MSPVDHVLKTDAELAAFASNDGHGQPTFNVAVEIRVRFEAKDYERKDKKDQMIHIAGKVFVAPNVTVNANDRLTIDGVNYRVISMQEMKDATGRLDHKELLITEY